MIKSALATLLSISSSQVISQTLLEGITPLQNGAVADADQINSNFSGVSSRILDIEQQVDLLIETSSRLVKIPDSSSKAADKPSAVTILNKNGTLVATIKDYQALTSSQLLELDGGKLSLDVDCTVDPYALVNAYHENTQYPRLEIGIQGNCYGDIFWNKEYTKYVQEFSQDITIYGMNSDESYAGIIPRPKTGDCGNTSYNPTGGRSGMVASFNGSLYVDYVTLQLGECDVWGFLYSRGAGGDVNDVQIIGHPDSANQIMISVRHNAIIYVGNVSAEGTGDNIRGVRVFNGGTVYSYGDLAVTTTGTALQMFGGGALFSYGSDISLSGAPALTMSGMSRYSNASFGSGGRTTIDGGFDIGSGSFFSTNHLNLGSSAQEDLKISSSHFNVETVITSEAEQTFQCTGNSQVDIAADYTIPFTEGSACLNSFQWSDLIRNYCETNSAC